ncbi:MAG: pyridoxamine 5'-phosphate oxidase family protein [Alphaproteobacteria bacterium]|nr:pyridoxamine 5'-phosphate oxidase family protein [Alphaproteobacteria bacterium]MDD9919970.1 pyridoxamine 5'-phosphate oxidase family protein [Alphaproteobacteria bacterium]
MTEATRASTAVQILKDITYLDLATVGQDGQPWCSPLFTAYDEKYNFYWVSSPNCAHSRNIAQNPKVGAVVYDSTAPEGTGDGVYMRGNALQVPDEQNEEGLQLLLKRTTEPFLPYDNADYFRGNNAPYKLYKMEVTEFSMLAPDRNPDIEDYVDFREKIDIR